MKKSLLILTTFFICITSNSQTFVKNNITYTVLSTSPNKVGVLNYNIAGGVNVTIPSSVTTSSSSKSTSNSASSTTYSVTSIENYAFQNKSIESVSIPSTVIEIGIAAFMGNKLREVTIPVNVNEIEASAFRNNPSMTCVTSLNTTPPTINSSTVVGSFEDRYKINLKVPAGTLTTYRSSSGGWSGFNNNGDSLENNDTFWDGYLEFKITSLANNTVTVIGYNTSGGTSLIIPETVSDCSFNFTVKEINTNAFIGDNITSVTIPNTVTIIKKNAFSSCNLTSLTIPNSVAIIEEGAFANNQIAGKLVIPNGVTTIGNYAFRGNSFSILTVPETLTSVGSTAFATINNLKEIFSFATTPPTIVTGGGSNSDSFGGNRSNIHLYIPVDTEGVYATNSGALWTGFNPVSEFFIDSHITYVVTGASPNTVKAIDYNSDGSNSLLIPNNITNASLNYFVKAIDDSAFYNNNLTTVTIIDGVETIGENAFKNNNIMNIVIPNSVTDIGENAFQNNQLTSVTLSSALTEIKSYVFQNNMLSSLTIPNNVTLIQKNAFENNQLTSLTIPSNINIIYQRAFKDNQLTNLNLENGISLIYYQAFENNQLTTITIPSSVTELGNACFKGNPLTDITSVRATAPNINTDPTWDTFLADRSGIDLTIPSGSMASYVTGANAEWTGFNSVTEDASLSVSNFEFQNDVKIVTTVNYISIQVSNNLKFKDYTIYSISGVKVASSKEKEIPTKFLSEGIYILKLDFDKGVFTKKILKQ